MIKLPCKMVGRSEGLEKLTDGTFFKLFAEIEMTYRERMQKDVSRLLAGVQLLCAKHVLVANKIVCCLPYLQPTARCLNKRKSEERRCNQYNCSLVTQSNLPDKKE